MRRRAYGVLTGAKSGSLTTLKTSSVTSLFQNHVAILFDFPDHRAMCAGSGAQLNEIQ